MTSSTLRLLLFATLAVSACSPVSSFRPASGLMPDKSLELGGGATVVTARPYVIEEPQGVGMLWLSGDVSRVANLTGIVVFDEEAAAIGGAARITYFRSDRFIGGVELEGGYVWLGTSLPVALRLIDQTHLYAGPRLGTWGVDPIFGAPVGLSVRVVGGLVLRAEWQRSWQSFKYYNKRDHYGGAVAYQF